MDDARGIPLVVGMMMTMMMLVMVGMLVMSMRRMVIGIMKMNLIK